MVDRDDQAAVAALVRFWRNHMAELKKAGVRKAARPWYRQHVEAYIKSCPDKRLRLHTGADVDNYLTGKGRIAGFQEWRFRQIVDALRLLFCQFLATEWAASYDWYRWRAFARELEPDHPTVARCGSALVAPGKNRKVIRFRGQYGDLHAGGG